MNIFSLPTSEIDVIQFLQKNGILHEKKTCINGHEMALTHDYWRCHKSNCRSKVSIRTSTWFEGVRISFLTAVRSSYCWSMELISINWCEKELGLNKNTAVEWNSYIREIVAVDLLKYRDSKIGGEGKIVEVDEALFTRRKNNAGRIFPPQWVFGGICRETNRCFLVEVEDRSAKTLIKAIMDHVVDGSTIYSDCWKGYKTEELNKAGYEQLIRATDSFQAILGAISEHCQPK